MIPGGRIVVDEREVQFGDLRLRFAVRTVEGEYTFSRLAGRADCGGYSVTSQSAIGTLGDERDDLRLFARIEANEQRIGVNAGVAASGDVLSACLAVHGLPATRLLSPSDGNRLPPVAEVGTAPIAVEYPSEISTPFAAVECVDGRFFVVRCTNLRIRRRGFAIRRGNGTSELTIEEAQRPSEPGPRLITANWNLGWAADVAEAAGAQRDAVIRLFDVKPLPDRLGSLFPPAARPLRPRLALQFSLHDQTDGPITFAEVLAVIGRLAENRRLDGVLVLLDGWAEVGSAAAGGWAPAVDRGGSTGLRQLCHEIGARGGCVSLWLNFVSGGESETSSRDARGRLDVESEATRQNVRTAIDRLVADVRPHAFAVRTVGTDLDDRAAEYFDGVVAILRALKDAHPGIGIVVDQPRDFLAALAPIAMTDRLGENGSALAPLRSLGGLVAVPWPAKGKEAGFATTADELPTVALGPALDEGAIVRLRALLDA